MTAVTELVRAMAGAGVSCAVAVPAGEGRAVPGVEVVEHARRRVPFGPLLALPREAGDDRILHVHGIATLTPWSGFWPRRWPGPVVATMHGTLDWRMRHPLRGLRAVWHRRLDVPLLRRMDGIHVTRPSEAAALARVGLPADRATEIPWTLCDEPAPPSARPPGPPYVTAVGRLHPIKGLDRLLEAFARLARRHATVRLRLAGAGPAPQVRALTALAGRLGIGDRVDLDGLLGRDALRRLVAGAAALALPSRYENFGMVVLEALRDGCPVVASRETPWECLGPAGAGRSVEFESADAAADALLEALDPAVRAARSPAARRLYEERFSPGVVVPRFVAWYASVLRTRRAEPAA